MAKLRLKWANKVLRAKSFVVLTDKESIIALSGIDPRSINDLTVLSEQAASIEEFVYRLQDLQREHDKIIAELTGGKAEKSKKTTTKRTQTKVTKRREK